RDEACAAADSADSRRMRRTSPWTNPTTAHCRTPYDRRVGLDWNPMARPKRGHGEEFAKLFRALEIYEPKEGDAKLARFREISEAPFETLGAPRVGFDASANKWLASNLRDKRKRAKAMVAMKGFYVLDLLPDCDGFPLYTNHGAYEGVDRYSFRAQFLS